MRTGDWVSEDKKLGKEQNAVLIAEFSVSSFVDR
jgi:hypothetical protein